MQSEVTIIFSSERDYGTNAPAKRSVSVVLRTYYCLSLNEHRLILLLTQAKAQVLRL